MRKRDLAHIFLCLVHPKPESPVNEPIANRDRPVRDQITWPTRAPMP